MNDASPRDDAASLEAVSVSKSFGGVRALSEASLSAFPGEVHALVGENGAGKSTLIKLLGGRLRADSGVIRLRGAAVALKTPDAAHRLGCWTVFQELTLLPAMSVAENLLLRREPRGAFGLTSQRRLIAAAEALFARFGIREIDPGALVEDLPLADRQVIEIVRALSHDPDILLLDEPTSALMERETAWLFGEVRRLRDAGRTIVFTSHRWHEIAAIADRITVFRGGRDVGSFTTLDEDEAVTLMTGQRVETLYPPRPTAPASAPALTVEGLAGGRLVSASFSLRRGEILGIGGLAGHGHRELFLMLFGAMARKAGRILREGREIRPRSPRQAIRAGIALVPEDRKTEGLLLPLSVGDNLTLAVLGRESRFGVLRRRRLRSLAAAMVARLKVRMPAITSPVAALSGGNQQKILLGRWLLADCAVLLFYDVTRGVDVATKHEIYELMTALAGAGRAILYYSSDAEELAHLAHRVLVLREGQIAAELPAESLTAERIVAAAMREPAAA